MCKCEYYRKKAGLSQHDLARLTGLTQTTICNIETGKTSPNMGTIVALVKYFKQRFPNDGITFEVMRGID